jgi:hypothetical protein
VAKCDGWDGAGEWIVHFIIIAHRLVTHSQDIIYSGSGCWGVSMAESQGGGKYLIEGWSDV